MPDETKQPSIVEQVQAVIDGTPEPKIPDAIPETPAEAPAEPETPEVEESPETPSEKPEKNDEPAEPADKAEPKVEIDAALRDAALQSGWSEQDIAEHIESAGADRATKTFTAMHDRLMRDIDALTGQPQGFATQQFQPQQPLTPGIVPQVLDARAKLKAKLAEQLDPESAAELDAVLAAQEQGIRQFQNYQQQQAVQNAARIVNSVIDRDFASKEYADVYGKPGARLTKAQFEKRQEVFQVADAMASRYNSLGRPISDEDAIVRAHLSVNRDRIQNSKAEAKKEAVEAVRQSVEKREKQRSIPPVSAKVAPGDDGDWRTKAIKAGEEALARSKR